MNEHIAFTVGLGATRSAALSALPDAPVVDDPTGRTRAARRWTAARLRGVARSTYGLANRVDPVRLPARHASA